LLTEVPLLVGIALVLAILVKSLLVQAFYIPSASMEPTLHGCPGCNGDRVLVDKLTYDFRDPRRGEVIVFDGASSFTPEVDVRAPSNVVDGTARWLGGLLGFPMAGERDFIKRVIGVAGDRVVCCDAEGRLSVNGVALDETDYLFPGDVPSELAFDVIVPERSLWVMGDHRSVSLDSRAHLGDPGGGMVPLSNVIGRARLVGWPVSHVGTLDVPDTFEQPALRDARAD
jgi:signal peptidase I